MEVSVMSNFSDKLSEQWQDGANLVLGLWLLVSPWLFGYAAAPTVAWNAYVVGVIIAVAAAAALIAFQKWEEWLNAVLGAWLIVSPWVLGYTATTAAMWNHIVVGALVLILAIWSATTEHRMVTKG
jgi:SPW repeat